MSILCPGVPQSLYRVRGQSSIPWAKFFLLYFPTQGPSQLTASIENSRDGKLYSGKMGQSDPTLLHFNMCRSPGMVLNANSDAFSKLANSDVEGGVCQCFWAPQCWHRWVLDSTLSNQYLTAIHYPTWYPPSTGTEYLDRTEQASWGVLPT